MYIFKCLSIKEQRSNDAFLNGEMQLAQQKWLWTATLSAALTMSRGSCCELNLN